MFVINSIYIFHDLIPTSVLTFHLPSPSKKKMRLQFRVYKTRKRCTPYHKSYRTVPPDRPFPVQHYHMSESKTFLTAAVFSTSFQSQTVLKCLVKTRTWLLTRYRMSVVSKSIRDPTSVLPVNATWIWNAATRPSMLVGEYVRRDWSTGVWNQITVSSSRVL